MGGGGVCLFKTIRHFSTYSVSKECLLVMIKRDEATGEKVTKCWDWDFDMVFSHM